MAQIKPIRWLTLSALAVSSLAIVLAMVPSASLADETIPDNKAAQQAKEDKTDYEFGGQILTLTEPKKDVAPSSDNPRFKDNKNGTVIDLETKLIWEQTDSYQVRKQWINWHKAQDYIRDLNEKKLGGSDNWRLPTREELATLFDEKQSIPWNYYWTKNELHIDPIFGKSHCCYWSSDEAKGEMAWGFNYIRGKPYMSMKGGIQHSLSVIRAVRNGDDSEQAKK
jgi:serine/threonine-protein kinase